jgi:glutathione synthase/RimK-type ligase-like ATP-grasp enzyme
MRHVALATAAEIPDGDEDFPALIAALAALRIEARVEVWDDPAAEWSHYDLVLPRATWDYAERRDEFLAWARSVPRVLNPVETLEWNTDKERYLSDLAAAGVPVVPTAFVPSGAELDPPDEPFVVKPAIGAGGRSSARFDPGQADEARALVRRIHAAGRTAMIQPFLAGEEKALVYLDGAYSHALSRRVPLPQAGEREVFFLDEQLAPVQATAEERAVAEAALPEGLLYGRVDLMDGLVLELEVAEPSLYLLYGEGAPERFAAGIAAKI